MEHVVLGAHDGVMSWMLRVGAERSEDEQRFVSTHERLHHELHQSTPWGLAMAAHAAFPGALSGPAWEQLGEGCRVVHEAYATYFSALADERFPALLLGNEEYLSYRELAAGLATRVAADPASEPLVVDALLRAAMAPAALARMSATDLRRLRPTGPDDPLLPDVRLARIRELMAADGAEAVRRALAHTGDGPGQMAFRAALADELGRLGVATMGHAQHRAWAEAVTAQLNALGGERFVVHDGPEDPVEAAFEDYQRERLRLHDEPLSLALVSPEDPGWEIAWLARAHDVVGAHAWLVWMRGDLLASQFALPAELPASGRPVLGFLAVDRVHGPPTARFWHFSALSPAIVAAGLRRSARMPVLFFTTLGTILDSNEGDDFRGISPAFVLIDRPLEGFLARTLERGARLSWRVSWPEGDRNVAVFAFEQDLLPGVYWIVATSHAGHDAIVAWLLRQPTTNVAHDPALMGEHVGYFDALLHHLIGSFYELSLFAGSAPVAG